MQNKPFYAADYQIFLMIFISFVGLGLITVSILFYQVLYRPIPVFTAVDPKKQQMVLTPEFEPNLLPSTLIIWASKASVAAYTFNFVNYNKELSKARPYFTEAGWNAYKKSIANTIGIVTKNQLFVNGVVIGDPVISNQGDFPGRGYAWRVQLPFLVTYQSAEESSREYYTVILTIVRVPTWINPAGIGIDQFVMEG